MSKKHGEEIPFEDGKQPANNDVVNSQIFNSGVRSACTAGDFGSLFWRFHYNLLQLC
jgi:hypothetical protein